MKTNVRSHNRTLKSGKIGMVKQHKRRINHSKILDFPTKKDFSLPVRSVIYVPTTLFDKPVSKLEARRRSEEVEKFLDKTFGGSTAIKGRGSFLSETGKLIGEDVIQVESFSTKEDYLKNDLKLKKFLQEKKKEWKQESMGFEYEGTDGNSKLVFV